MKGSAAAFQPETFQSSRLKRLANKGIQLDVGTIAFCAACMVNLVDLMGTSFCNPVLVPYGQQLGADKNEIALFQTVRFAVGVVSIAWMPRFADKYGTKVTLLLSTVGSGVAYMIQALSQEAAGCDVVPFSASRFEQLKLNATLGGDRAGNATADFLPSGMRACSAVGAAWECEEACDNKNGVYMMLAGRAFAGFFGGSMPVLRAFITAVSLPNVQVLKFRLTVLFAFMQGGNFALAPLAGAIAPWGLHLPWLVSAGTAAVSVVFTILFFKNAEEVKRKQADKLSKDVGADGGAKKPHRQASKTAGPPETSPYKDKILLLLVVAYILVFSVVSGMWMLQPLLLQYDDFELTVEGDIEQTRANLANATGVLMVPHGVCNLIFSTVIFMLVSGRLGDRPTLRIGGFIGAVCMALTGYLSSKFWIICVIQGVAGMGIGLFVPALGPMLQRYNAAAHSSTLAQASAIPMFGMQIGMICGPIVYTAIAGDTRARMNIAWLLCGISFLCSLIVFDTAFGMMTESKAMKRQQMTPKQLKAAMESDAKDEDEFIDEICSLVRAMFTKDEKNPHYRGFRTYHGAVQRLLLRVMNDTFPFVTKISGDLGDDLDKTEQYLQDVGHWIATVGTCNEIQSFREKFPHIQLPDHEYHGEDGQYVHYVTHSHVDAEVNRNDPLEERRQSDGSSGRRPSDVYFDEQVPSPRTYKRSLSDKVASSPVESSQAAAHHPSVTYC